jgi:hypothetical protein
LYADDGADKAQKAVEISGGLVFRDDKADGKPIVGAFLTKDAQLKDLQGIDSLCALTLGPGCTDAALKDLKNVKNLHFLWLCWAWGVTAEGLNELKNWEGLQVICFLSPPTSLLLIPKFSSANGEATKDQKGPWIAVRFWVRVPKAHRGASPNKSVRVPKAHRGALFGLSRCNAGAATAGGATFDTRILRGR